MNYSLNEDKTEAATPHKIKQFKKNGYVQHLFDLNSFFILLFFFCIFYINKKFIFLHLLKLFVLNLTFNKKFINYPQLFFVLTLQHIKIFILCFLILFLGITCILIFSPIFIHGEIVRIRFLNISLNSLNIISNFKKKNFFNIIIDFLSSLLKIIIIITVSFLFIWNNYFNVNNFYYNSLSNNLYFGFYLIYKYLLLMMVIIGIIAVIDTIIKYLQYFNKLKMTVQEVKNEQKELEGNPLIKQRIQFLMRKSSYKYSISELTKSDVIIFNSINCAVAIHYNSTTMSSPKVLFKGLEKLSIYIVEFARKNNIPVFISDSLAIYLYNNSFVDNQIPVNLHSSIAKILAWAWQVKRWKKYGGTYPMIPVIFFNKS
ncbi:EscU/YscU/HrcU family type III secretion system export apparatus switch protein [Buchnera aphidicola]|uniref:Flagellar biosynthetic protein FlhB n=1 Tax=Buchnera aphidicola (Cinara laricifoliae) TaxID=2518977 RepID=A0A451DBE4_9GAMM|nr:EscU/YscU/HrcU family type III secretion system export apparatus switch protein [Buchnera aphidicola]VFP83646.1 Flagellar biosynthetic protein FlhB [Buchnera aphidicola (Cinara laricifoliae)]